MNPLPNPQDLLRTARERTGLSAGLDPAFDEALEQLVRSIDADSALPADGRDAAAERLLRVIENRLRTDDDLQRHPDILAEPLLPPLVICGLPRVGSTKLHQLLAKTGDFQSLLFWQGFNPARRDGQLAETERKADAVHFLEWRSRRNPLSDAAHYLAANEPEEDTYLLEYTLRTWWPVSYFEIPGFLRWVRRQDRDPVFHYVRTLLQYLQWQFHRGGGRPWVLKSPPNLGYEAEIARHLPGARFVMLHRDPTEVIPSAVAIVRELRRLYGEGAGDLRKVGAWAMEEFGAAMERHLRWRSGQAPGSVLDVAYTQVRDDYEAVVANVYRFCGMELGDIARERMRTWAGDNEQHKHGVHQYTLDEAGLSAEAIRRRFAGYLESFAAYTVR